MKKYLFWLLVTVDGLRKVLMMRKKRLRISIFNKNSLSKTITVILSLEILRLKIKFATNLPYESMEHVIIGKFILTKKIALNLVMAEN